MKYRREIDGLGERSGLVRIRPDRVFCDTWIKDSCVATLDGEVLYYDDDHLSNAGARHLVKLIAAKL
jgi:hypothetical protein